MYQEIPQRLKDRVLARLGTFRAPAPPGSAPREAFPRDFASAAHTPAASVTEDGDGSQRAVSERQRDAHGARMETGRGGRALVCRPLAHLVWDSSGRTGAR